MFKLAIIVGTDRPNSKSQLMAEYVQTLYVGLGVDAQIYSMSFFPLSHVVGGPYGENIPEVEGFIAPILASDALLFIIPEYNGSFPGILKIFVDYLPFPDAFQAMPIAYIGISAGAFGSLRAVEQFQMVANYRNALSYPERLFISRFSANFSIESGLTIPTQKELLESQTKGFVDFVLRLQ
tara:strand:+ start:365 stop:907 length:543 start_codon:yes stop_codon:yes gene_type:complete